MHQSVVVFVLLTWSFLVFFGGSCALAYSLVPSKSLFWDLREKQFARWKCSVHGYMKPRAPDSPDGAADSGYQDALALSVFLSVWHSENCPEILQTNLSGRRPWFWTPTYPRYVWICGSETRATTDDAPWAPIPENDGIVFVRHASGTFAETENWLSTRDQGGNAETHSKNIVRMTEKMHDNGSDLTPWTVEFSSARSPQPEPRRAIQFCWQWTPMYVR
jgi:hypothetical protein